MNFNLKYYRVFLAVYENRSMSLAAEKMHFSQPAVSRIIQELEAAYKTRFFFRHSGMLQYTEGGRKFYRYVSQLIDVEEQLDRAMQEHQTQMKVHIGATPTIATYYLPDIIEKYRRENGLLDVYIHVCWPHELENMLKNALLDFAVVEDMRSTYEIEVKPLVEDDLVFISDRQNLDYPVIPILIRDLGERARRSMEEALFEAGLNCEVKGMFSDVEGIKQYVGRGMGVGIVPRRTVLSGDQLYILDLPQLSFRLSIGIAHHHKKFIFPQLTDLMECIGNALQKTDV